VHAGDRRGIGKTNRRTSPALDDKHGLVIDAVLFVNLVQVLVLIDGALQDRVTNLLRRLILVVRITRSIRCRSNSSLPS
jgi:hypothetical protein